MKLTWDNIDNIYLSKRGYFTINKRRKYIGECPICKDLCISYTKEISFCCRECQSISFRGDNNHRYGVKVSDNTKERFRISLGNKKFRGGKEYVYYDSFVNKLKPYGEKCRRSPSNLNKLEVKCYHCKEWFIPRRSLVNNRIQTIKGNKDNRLFYCSDTCRSNCYVFNKHWTSFIDINKPSVTREVQSELRQMVFYRDDYTCQICGVRGGNLHCHHIDPVKSNPIESADINNCITLCKQHHINIHKQNGCKYNDLASC